MCLWNKAIFHLEETLVGFGFLGVRGRWGESAASCFIFNIHSPCNLVGKRALWEDLRELRDDNLNSPWCLAGDFNAVRCISESRGHNFCTQQERCLSLMSSLMIWG